ncbi:tRNA threonylcarbamoyladenosine dehydratase [Snodgrassella gandavensis]|uniref:tRNA threonylcarbamoyladenosine dehydratase n=1 Tax=Snodgrassella gandavensis TaxID=2946698 RepID=UPI001EF66FEC|nr:tRNA threonylcarbamoyladenosine dehydratase [Snodgrassella gandavensis]
MFNFSANYQRRFGGIARLYGEDCLQRFASAHVCVVGVGGVGSWAIEALARSGIGALTLIDLDNVAESNINRQLPALISLIGKPKVEALAERIADINPECQVTCIEDFVDTDNLSQIFSQPFDFVIDAIDQVRVKAAMAAFFITQRQPFIVSGGAGGQKNAALIQCADLSRVTNDRMLANMRYTLRKRHGFSRQPADKMHIPCIYSSENITPPQAGICHSEQTAPQGLSCAGYGAAMVVTASFGLRCTQACLEHLCKQ